ncbi:MAG: phosphate ABC transporter permease subunit PstC [Proteobacteria bacterium]|nr:phosphate ABC transporter permease subunit PstC [Pseudomonadota bacterium]MBU1715832.1 phosphate ABC transporter permease subunit PstC [Pseudomonadota bacterium]
MRMDKFMRLLLISTASISILIVALIFLFLGKEAFPFALEPGLGKLFDSRWVPVSFQEERYGIYPLVAGSSLVTLLAMLISIPLSIIGAIYISEVAQSIEREILKPFIEILASIPSVVLGFFGLVVLAPLVKNIFGLSSGLNALTAALLLALMALPTIITISEDALASVPQSFKQASLALGASELQTIFKVTVPAALPGIIAAIMLGIGRVIGETMAVLMVSGNSAIISFYPLDSIRTMTATIAAEMGEVPFGSHHYQALFWIGIVLLFATFVLNILSRLVLKKYGMAQ